MPRHPPCALKNKTLRQHTNKHSTSIHRVSRSDTQKNIQKIKMLASTIQFSHNTPSPPPTTHNRAQSLDNHDLMKKQHITCHFRHPTACHLFLSSPTQREVFTTPRVISTRLICVDGNHTWVPTPTTHTTQQLLRMSLFKAP